MSMFFKRLLADTQGATAIEYGLIAALLGVALITTFQNFETQLNGSYNATSSAMSVGNAGA